MEILRTVVHIGNRDSWLEGMVEEFAHSVKVSEKLVKSEQKLGELHNTIRELIFRC